MQHTIRIDPDQYQSLVKRQEKTGLTIAEMVRQALRAAIQKWDKQ
jgi:Ribbon-helix-helix domain